MALTLAILSTPLIESLNLVNLSFSKYALIKKDDELFANSAPNLVEAYGADGQYKKAYLLKDNCFFKIVLQ